MPLIPDPQRTLTLLSCLLRPGGRISTIIFDHPTGHTTILGLLVDYVPRALGIHVPFSWRDWMKGQNSLMDAVVHAGLEVITVMKTKSYIPESQLEPEQAEMVFKEVMETSQKNSQLASAGVREQAQKTFKREFEREARRNGGLFYRWTLAICRGGTEKGRMKCS